MTMKLKVKRVGKALHIIGEEDSSILPLTTEEQTNKAMDTLIATIYQIAHINEDLRKSVMDDQYVDQYSTEANQALFDDATLNIPSHICKELEKAMACAPAHLQGQVLKALAKATARIYQDASEQVMAVADSHLLSKSLHQKALTIAKDIDLIEEQLDAGLEAVKQFHYEKSIKQKLVKAGMDRGSKLERMKFAGITDEELEAAAAIVKAKRAIGSNKDQLSKAIKDAKKIVKE